MTKHDETEYTKHAIDGFKRVRIQGRSGHDSIDTTDESRSCMTLEPHNDLSNQVLC